MRSKNLFSRPVLRNGVKDGKRGFKKALIKRFAESAGILFSALLVFTTIVYAITWAPGGPPQAAPGDGNVELTSGGTSLWDTDDTDVYRESGNVGIGTTSPVGLLDVTANTNGLARSYLQNINTGVSRRQDLAIRTGAEAIYLGLDQAAALGDIAYLDNRSGGDFTYYYNGSPQMTILTAGNVGIGTASPAQKLHVAGTARVDGAIVSPEGTLRDDGGGWVRTYGSTGWYNQSYGGGWYMTDTSWIRSYNSKSVYTGSGIIRSDASVRAPIFYDQDNTGYYVDPASTSRLNAVSPNSIKMYGNLDLNGGRITGGQALDGQVCQIAIYASIEGGGIKWNYAQWIDSSGWQRLGTGGGAIIDSQKIYNIAIKCK